MTRTPKVCFDRVLPRDLMRFQNLAEALAGKPITAAQTRPYGCSVKY